jgi:nicotinamide riboside kinase
MRGLIAVSGTHGAGKSTLARDAAESLHAPVIEEVPRALIEEVGDPSFLVRGKNTFGRQALVIVRQLAAEASALEAAARPIFCDRSVVDHWAYSMLAIEELPQAEQRLFEQTILAHARRYELVVICEPLADIKEDGVREEDVGFQSAVDMQIRDLYRRAGVAFEILSGDERQRLTRMTELVRALPNESREPG